MTSKGFLLLSEVLEVREQRDHQECLVWVAINSKLGGMEGDSEIISRREVQ